MAVITPARPSAGRPGLTVPGLDFLPSALLPVAKSTATVTHGGGTLGGAAVFTRAVPAFARPGLTVPGLDIGGGGGRTGTSAASVSDPRDGTASVF
jgi:hypothetical protein